jgi:hypothetical protein
MAVAFDAKMTTGNSDGGRAQQAAAATSISSTGMAVGGSATLLIATLSFGSASQTPPTGISMTWDGVAMTAGPSVLSQSGGNFGQAAIFYLVNPAVGNKTLAASWTNANDLYMSCASFTGTDTTTGIKVSDNTTATQTTTIAVPTETTGASVACQGCNGADPTTTQTEIFSTAPLGPGGGASYAIGGSGTNSHGFTEVSSTRQALVGVHVLPTPPASYEQSIFRFRNDDGVLEEPAV